MAEKNLIGSKIQQIREHRKLTVEELATRGNLCTELVQKIEAGELCPSLSPLMKIARVLGVRLGTFLDDTPMMGPVVSRNTQSQKVMHFSDRKNAASSDLDFYALATDKQDRHMEPFIIDIFPDSSSEVATSSHEGEEFIYVLDGEVEVVYGKEKYHLSVGDSIYYDSIIDHHVHSLNGSQAKILAVIYGVL